MPKIHHDGAVTDWHRKGLHFTFQFVFKSTKLRICTLAGGIVGNIAWEMNAVSLFVMNSQIHSV